MGLGKVDSIKNPEDIMTPLRGSCLKLIYFALICSEIIKLKSSLSLYTLGIKSIEQETSIELSRFVRDNKSFW